VVAPESITGQPNTIVNSYNRNFPKRNDGSANTLSFVTSPDTVMALALAGRLDFDPVDRHSPRRHREVTLDPRSARSCPTPASTRARTPSPRPPADGSASRWPCPRLSDRLQLLEPFPPWDGEDYLGLPVLMKAQGKCTTDHISGRPVAQVPRPPREHLGQPVPRRGQRLHRRGRHGKDITDGETRPYPEIAKRYHEAGILGGHRRRELRRGLVARARRHGAPLPWRPGDPRPLSFARIHETNLKKQGLLPLTFADPATYDLIGEDDRINVLGLPPVPGENVQCQIVKPDGTTIDFEAVHTFSPEQVEWFEAGSALNIVRQVRAVGRQPPAVARRRRRRPTLRGTSSRR
jgi:aconitate hydratase